MYIYTYHFIYISCVFVPGAIVPVLGSLGIPGGEDPDEAIYEAIQGGGQDEFLGRYGIYVICTIILYVAMYISYCPYST